MINVHLFSKFNGPKLMTVLVHTQIRISYNLKENSYNVKLS